MGIHERKEREKERRKEEILDAAQRVFFEKGLNSATMDEIAEAAELSKATLYLHFVSKEDLYLAVAIRGLRIAHELFREAIDGGTTIVESLNGVKKAYTTLFNSHRNYFRMFSFFQTPQFHKQVSEAMKDAFRVESDNNWEMIISFFVRGVREHRIRNDFDPVEMAIVIWSNAASLMSRIDSEHEVWKQRRNIDLNKTLETSFRLLIESILTPEARLEYAELLRDEKTHNQFK
jgi:AcrR family transcriptional regulator